MSELTPIPYWLVWLGAGVFVASGLVSVALLVMIWMDRKVAESNAMFLMGLAVRMVIDAPLTGKDSEGYIYLVQSGDRYKIGMASSPMDRFKSLQTANPESLILVHIIKTNAMRAAESHLHARFLGKRTRGEWFALNTKDCIWLQSIKEIELQAESRKLEPEIR